MGHTEGNIESEICEEWYKYILMVGDMRTAHGIGHTRSWLHGVGHTRTGTHGQSVGH